MIKRICQTKTKHDFKLRHCVLYLGHIYQGKFVCIFFISSLVYALLFSRTCARWRTETNWRRTWAQMPTSTRNKLLSHLFRYMQSVSELWDLLFIYPLGPNLHAKLICCHRKGTLRIILKYRGRTVNYITARDESRLMRRSFCHAALIIYSKFVYDWKKNHSNVYPFWDSSPIKNRVGIRVEMTHQPPPVSQVGSLTWKKHLI